MKPREFFERYAIRGFGEPMGGAYEVPYQPPGRRANKVLLRVIASWGMGWDHVSVSLEHRTPKWAEMERVRRTFFHDHETAMQLHVPPGEHINCHPYCLHIWRPQKVEIPRPPSSMVGWK